MNSETVGAHGVRPTRPAQHAPPNTPRAPIKPSNQNCRGAKDDAQFNGKIYSII
ncbi:MAG: hypothetical protein RIM23_29005 [Coleofasciculus sp. G3-WIS-01]|uniref:hypothetical protein n=1 Tax=Coleofasciculus sp. G3-WIS-01 TaxID=3069528 RepID=UPI00330345B4